MSLNWTHQFKATRDLVRTKGKCLLEHSSKLSISQALLIEEQCILGAIWHVLTIQMLTPKQLTDIDILRAQYIKPILSLPSCTTPEVCYLQKGQYGLGCESIHAIAAQLAGEHHCASHNDTGRLGTFSRALTTAQSIAAPSSSASATPTLSTPLLAWLGKPTSLSLHRVALVASLGLSTDAPSLSAPLPHNSDLHELVFDKITTFPIVHTLRRCFGILSAPCGL